ncbi:MAG TPA: branched-chain amino acid ABC transporter permease [Tepidisphaeraceae bacterium]|jgi:branched-chain amino acid transport system permease protein|nr:branched-chain amino acid ABC transporter permease [Tepidisphaeraceae bacterium]
MHVFLQELINGLSIGAVYALIALGYTMVYGVLKLINFAHGDVYMVGAVIAYELAVKAVAARSPIWVTLPVIFLGAMGGCAILGFVIEYLCYRPLRHRPRLVALITAIGVSLLLENLFQNRLVFGATPRILPELLPIRPALSWAVGSEKAPVVVTNLDLISMGLCLAMMAVLSWFVLRTKMGLALRAVSFRVDTASLMGINTNRVISMTFVLGSALAAVAGVVDAMRYQVDPLMGLIPGIKAFIAAVLGGIGSIPGALLGGLLMGLVETLLKGYLPAQYNNYSNAAAFVVLILILLVRPSGLLGKTTVEKV